MVDEMKKIPHFYFLSASCLLSVCLAACAVDSTECENPGISAKGRITLAAAIDNDSATRTALTGGTGTDRNNVKFQDGDALSVSTSSGENVKFTMVGKPAADGSASFTGDLEPTGGSIYALYPYSSSVSFTPGSGSGTWRLKVPEYQTPVDDSFDPAAAFSVGVANGVDSNGQASITLKNVCSLVKFRVPEGHTLSSAEFWGEIDTGTKPFQLGVDVNLTSSGTLSVGEFLYAANLAVLRGTMTSGHDYYFVLTPTTLKKGFSITLYETVDGKEVKCGLMASDKVTELKPGTILNVGEISAEWEGSGTAADPYLIQSAADLMLLKNRLENKIIYNRLGHQYNALYYRQTAHIDCGGKQLGIGTSDNRFEGHYDGGGYTIGNYRLGGDCPGLFSHVCNASISGLSVSPATDVSNHVVSGGYQVVGCMVGQAEGNCTFSRCTLLPGTYVCSLEFSQSGISLAFGGLVGKTAGASTFINCTNDGQLRLDGANYFNTSNFTVAGGIVGFAENAGDYNGVEHIIFDRCRNNGSISTDDQSAKDAAAGGIVGYVRDNGSSQALVPQVYNCVNKGAISSTAKAEYFSGNNAYAGGIIGQNGSDGYNDDIPWVHNCLNTGTISAYGNDASCGGIIGYCYDEDTRVAVCINIGTIVYSKENNNDPHNGAICGMGTSGLTYYGGTCESCYWLDATDSPQTPSVEICYNQSHGGYHYSYIPYTKAEDCIFKDNDYLTVSNTGWTKSEWKSKAVHWKGSATYGSSSNDLDLDF